MKYYCAACGTELTKEIYVADFLSGIVTDDSSVDLCETCHKYMIDAVKKAWKEIYKINDNIG